MLRNKRQTAVTLLLAAAAVTSACAQISDPNNMVSGPPKPHAPQRPPSELDNITWLWQYTRPVPNGRAAELSANPHFLLLLGQAFPQQQAMWGQHEALRQVIPAFTQRYGAVRGTANRYFTLDGCVPRLCAERGLLWIDMRPRKGDDTPLMIFAAEHWEENGRALDDPKAPFDLWLFANKPVDALSLPAALTEAIAEWDRRLGAAGRGVPHIQQALVIQPDGTPQPVPTQLTGANRIPPQVETLSPPDKDDAQ